MLPDRENMETLRELLSKGASVASWNAGDRESSRLGEMAVPG